MTGANTPPSKQNIRTVFGSLMLGMFLAAMSSTIIAPAMPRIVSELGAMEHYSWIAVSTLLATTVVVPIAGKLSDLYGRKLFYTGGIVVFMLSSLIAGSARNYEIFIFGRIVEGIGMGTMMPLSQAIIADLISPRERGKYQGLMGAMFGLASIIGPFLGGFITEALNWRWLFYINIPLALVALTVVVTFMHIPHVRRAHRIDYAGFATLTLSLTTLLLGTVWGGIEYPWRSPQIIGLFGVGLLSLIVFLKIEQHASEPVIPLHLWANRIFTTTNIAMMMVAMAMFGSIYYIPVFVQGVLGTSVLGAGAVLTPMTLGNVAMSAVSGYLVSRTGRYKFVVIGGVLILGTGIWLLTLMNRTTPYPIIVRNMAIVGLGLGACMQTFVIIVQNAVSMAEIGVATATTQLSRSIGSAAGIALLGAIMTDRLRVDLPMFLSNDAMADLARRGFSGADPGAILNPQVMATLTPSVQAGFRDALALALHPVFLSMIPFAVIALGATLLIPEKPLRQTIHEEPAETGRHLLDELSQAG